MKQIRNSDQVYYFSLDMVRALGSLAFVLYHAFQLAVHLYPKIYQWGFPAHFGIECFYVMSGFLITGLLYRLKDEAPLTGSQILRKFWIRRWLRTFPAYFTILIIILIVYGFAIPDGKSVWTYFLFLQTSYSVAPVFFPESWSICIEEWFYILLPLIFLICANGNRNIFLNAVVLIIVVLGIVRAFYSFSYDVDFETGIKKILWMRIDAPFYGVAAWLIINRNLQITKAQRTILLILGLALQGVAIFIYKYNDAAAYKSALLAPVMLGGFALMLPALLRYEPRLTFWHRFIQKIAGMSFSIYLTHLSLVQFTLLPLLKFDKSPSGVLLSVIAYLCLTTIATLLLHYLIEKPVLRLRSRLYPA